MSIFKFPGNSNTYQSGEPWCDLEAIGLHIRKADLEMPEYRAMLMVKQRLEFTFGSHSVILMEEEMATHSSIPVGKILWTEEPGGLQSIGSQRVGHT